MRVAVLKVVLCLTRQPVEKVKSYFLLNSGNTHLKCPVQVEKGNSVCLRFWVWQGSQLSGCISDASLWSGSDGRDMMALVTHIGRLTASKYYQLSFVCF